MLGQGLHTHTHHSHAGPHVHGLFYPTCLPTPLSFNLCPFPSSLPAYMLPGLHGLQTRWDLGQSSAACSACLLPALACHFHPYLLAGTPAMLPTTHDMPTPATFCHHTLLTIWTLYTVVPCTAAHVPHGVSMHLILL